MFYPNTVYINCHKQHLSLDLLFYFAYEFNSSWICVNTITLWWSQFFWAMVDVFVLRVLGTEVNLHILVGSDKTSSIWEGFWFLIFFFPPLVGEMHQKPWFFVWLFVCIMTCFTWNIGFFRCVKSNRLVPQWLSTFSSSFYLLFRL